MIIISDTSIITNLIQLSYIDLLYGLFEKITIAKSVELELRRKQENHLFLNDQKLIIRTASNKELLKELNQILDPGKAESIALAIEFRADLLLIDERKGRKIAEQNGIKITGLLGILLLAKQEKMISEIKPILRKLINDIGFRIGKDLYNMVLIKANEE